MAFSFKLQILQNISFLVNLVNIFFFAMHHFICQNSFLRELFVYFENNQSSIYFPYSKNGSHDFLYCSWIVSGPQIIVGIIRINSEKKLFKKWKKNEKKSMKINENQWKYCKITLEVSTWHLFWLIFKHFGSCIPHLILNYSWRILWIFIVYLYVSACIVFSLKLRGCNSPSMEGEKADVYEYAPPLRHTFNQSVNESNHSIYNFIVLN